VTKIVAFSGRKQSGKSTSGEFIQNFIYNLGSKISCKIYSFADPLKRKVCIDLLGLTEAQCYGSDEDKNSLTKLRWKDMPGYDVSWTWNQDYDVSGFMTARQVMEFVGTVIFRQMKTNTWEEATLKEIKRDNLDLAIIVDARFPDEVDPILDNGGYVIRLTRNPFNSNAKPETALDPDKYDWNRFSCIIDNEDITIDQKNELIKKFLTNKGILSL